MDFQAPQTKFDQLIYTFRQLFPEVKQEPRIILAPYRICPLGAHVDHQGGTVLGRAINAYTTIVYTPCEKAEMRLFSTNYPGEAQICLGQLERPREWPRYAWGAMRVLGEDHDIQRGIFGLLHGTMPDSGLSSSASVGLAYLHALADVNGLELDHEAYIELDRKLENEYMGVSNGILDQSIIQLSEPDSFIHLDTRTQMHTHIPDPACFSEVQFLVIESGADRKLRGTGYNDRVTECKVAADLIASAAKLGPVDLLSDIPRDVYESVKDLLPPMYFRRAEHYFSEDGRARRGAEAWASGDWGLFGKLMNESGMSSIENYKTGVQETIQLHHVTSSTPGILGCRFSGGGFGGCVVALVRRDKVESAARQITKVYDRMAGQSIGSIYLAQHEGSVRKL